MKRFYQILFYTASFISVSQGQPVKLWGTNCNNETQYGNLGNVFKINSDGAGYQNIHNFNAGYIGGNPFSNVIEGTDGWLYSSSVNGGLFRYNPLTDEYITTLASGSDPATAYEHRGDLVELNGQIWGISDQGGTYGAGAIYSWNISTGVYHEYPAFADITIDGGVPMGGFVVGPNNLLYATTSTGGANGAGVIFSFDPVNHVYTKLYDINGTSNGQTPQGALLSIGDGALYGTTTLGGANSGGVLFRFTPATSQFEELHAFDSIGGNNNSLSYGKLAFLNGNLFGTCLEGGTNGSGVIYSFELATGIYTKRFDFPAGYSCLYGLTKSTNSILLGSIISGGPDNGGLLYAFDSSDDTFTILTGFVGSEIYGENTGVLGYYPIGEPLLASNGNVYIQTSSGAVGGGGALVHFDPTLSTSISDFQYFEAVNGNNPQGQLTYAGGKLFGLAEGGPNSSGIIYSIDPSDGGFALCYDFPDPANGRVPVYKSPSTLTYSSDGFLYGSASGGSNGTGVLFKFNPNTLQYTKIFDFPSDSTQGYWPNGGLFEYTPGKFIGTTYRGGNSNAGVIFTYDATTGQYQKRFDFDGAALGKYPLGGLVKALDGKFYGIAWLGGNYYDPTSPIVRGGVLFSYDLANNVYEIHHDFGASVTLNGLNGISLGITPVTYSLVLTNDGKLCSGSAVGGVNRGFFAYDPQTKQFISPFLLSPFIADDTTYIELAGEYYPASDGNLYAITKAYSDLSIPGSQLFAINPKDFSVTFLPTIINGAHFNNFYGNQLTEVSPHNTDAGMMTVQIPGHNGTSCTGDIAPVCFMKNWGNLPISNANIRYKLNNGNWNTTNWSGQLWMGHFVDISLPVINVPAGNNTLTVVCDAGDGNPMNDTVSISFRTTAPAGPTAPFAENFDSGSGLSNYSVYNYDNRQTWEITGLAAHSAPSSLMIDNFNYKAYNQYDEIDLPEINLTTTSNPQLSFWHAYALNTTNEYYDTLQVLVSTNCGESFELVYEKSQNALSTVPNFTTAGMYTPGASDWRRDTVDLSIFSEAPSAIVRFRNITSYNNRLFIDDINIGTAPASVSNLQPPPISVNLFPNPNQGSFRLNIANIGSETLTISVVDITGKTLKSWTNRGTIVTEQVSMNELEPGMYSLVATDGKGQKSVRFTVTH